MVEVEATVMAVVGKELEEVGVEEPMEVGRKAVGAVVMVEAEASEVIVAIAVAVTVEA